MLAGPLPGGGEGEAREVAVLVQCCVDLAAESPLRNFTVVRARLAAPASASHREGIRLASPKCCLSMYLDG